jgi:hypothetical protein
MVNAAAVDGCVNAAVNDSGRQRLRMTVAADDGGA